MLKEVKNTYELPYMPYLFKPAAEDYKPLIKKLLPKAKAGDEQALKELIFLNDFLALSYSRFVGQFKEAPKALKKAVNAERYAKRNDVFSNMHQKNVESFELENFDGSTSFQSVALSEKQITERENQALKNQKQLLRKRAS